MAKKRKEGWAYIYSPDMGMEIAYHHVSGRVYCEDKTQYSPQELQLMKDAGLVMDLLTHTVKRLFRGEIVEVRAAVE
jgi:hypothetical protein